MDSRGANISAGVDTIAALHVAEVITEKIIRELLKSFRVAWVSDRVRWGDTLSCITMFGMFEMFKYA